MEMVAGSLVAAISPNARHAVERAGPVLPPKGIAGWVMVIARSDFSVLQDRAVRLARQQQAQNRSLQFGKTSSDGGVAEECGSESSALGGDGSL